MIPQEQVKARIPHTWPLFFARHGRFTPIQQLAIPTILDGQDALIISATASGKTEAVLAPLLERLWTHLHQPPATSHQQPATSNQPPATSLSLLYICPTRALVGDLYRRLQPILADSGISLGMKTGDVALAQTPPALLLTTPESTDALLTRAARLFANVQAIVLDEIHLFDNTPRGDHLRCLLARIERIRQYAHPEAEPAQRVALSATVPDPEGVARRYLRNGRFLQTPGGRAIMAEIRPLYDLDTLVDALASRSAYKSLIFCNSRDEVEQTAVLLRQRLPHHADIFVHYSNLDAAVRRDVEERFAQAAVAVCVATSTLELGVDIGSVDDVALLGAPPDLNAFLQRIGRGSRRAAQTPVLCLPKSPGEWARFEALLALAENRQSSIANRQSSTYGFRPSVLVQQIFSLIKQSPTGAVRLADVRRIAPPEVTSEAIRQIVAQLTYEGYLQIGRFGEWKPDEKLQELLDRQEIYSNIGGDARLATAVDAYSGQVLGQTERAYPPGAVLLFGGRPMVVVWQEFNRFGLKAAPGQPVDEVVRLQKPYAAIPFAVTQQVARSMGLAAGEMVALPQAAGGYLFHFGGTVWGMVLTAVLQANQISANDVNEFCLSLSQPLQQLPPWSDSLAAKAARTTFATLSNRLEMGRFHSLLPANLAAEAMLAQIDLPRLGEFYQAARITAVPHLAESLHLLLQ